MSIFGPQTPGPTRINRIQINQSVLGYALPVVMGKGKVQQSILWADGETAVLINTNGGKGFGGGKDGNQFVYSADVIAGLCEGPVTGIGDVWSGQSWLSNTNAAETTVIEVGTPYLPAFAASLTADQGVSTLVSYSGTFNDIGSTGTSLSGTHPVSLAKVPYGTTLAAGQYSVNPATNGYYFSGGDAGKTVTVNYSFDLTSVKRQDIALIPESGQVIVGSSSTGTAATPVVADGGVTYYTTGGITPTTGAALTAVAGSPGAGQYSVSGTEPATYQFSAADVGKEVLITYRVNVNNTIPTGTSKTLNFILYEGYPLQEPASLVSSNYPGASLGYSNTAYVAYFPMDLGYGDQIQQNVFEVLTSDAWGGGIPDCNPVQCILQVLTNPVWGLGTGAVPFPTSAVDNGPSGTWGTPTPTGVARQESTASAWFAANGFFISPVIDKQDTAAGVISRWLEAGQCAAFMSEGLLKLVPYGDTSTAGNGAIWVAPSAYAVPLNQLNDDVFIPKSEGADPVKISCGPWQDAYNTVQVAWNNRSNQYAQEITPESDQAAINRYGSRIEDPQSWDFITTLPSAVFAASMRVKRGVYTRNTYEFTLPYRYSYLECMDVVPISTQSAWIGEGLGNENLNIVNLPVRITKAVDNPDGTIDFTAEDYPFGANQPTLYPKHIVSGLTPVNLFAEPGNTEAVVFEATNRLTGFAGDQIWIGAVGANADWGGCNILASMDGTTYKQIGQITTPARIGTLDSAFAAGADPDTTNTLIVNLAENSGPLEGGTTENADADVTLCYVDGELIAYSTIALVGLNQYAANGYIRRGQMGSAISAHAAGSFFARLDNAIFKYTYDPTWAGKTVQLKFQSFNVHGNAAQDPSTISPVSFTVPGLNTGTVNASTGVVISLYVPPNVPTNVSNNATLDCLYDAATNTSYMGIYGPGAGVGGAFPSWSSFVGSVSTTYPAASINGIDPTLGEVYVIYDTTTSTYLLVPTADYVNVLSDFYIVIGTISIATSTSGATYGGYGAPTSYTPPVRTCTVEGTPIDTPDGPVDNRILKNRLDRGEDVFLQGRFGPERIAAAEWAWVYAVCRVRTASAEFECSESHMLRVGGHYRPVVGIPTGQLVETRSGYAEADITLVRRRARVLHVHLEGPSHEYSVSGVMTHNLKEYP